MRAKNEYKFLAEAYQNVYKERPVIEESGNLYGGPYRPGHAFPVKKRFQLLSVGGRHSEHAQFQDEFDTVDEVINSIDLPEEYGTEWAEEIKDVSNWSSEGFEDGLRRFGIGEIYEVIDIGSYEDDDLEDAEEPDEYHPGYEKVKPKVELKPKKMEFTKGNWAKNTKAGKE
jgi:hypothetical protein